MVAGLYTSIPVCLDEAWSLKTPVATTTLSDSIPSPQGIGVRFSGTNVVFSFRPVSGAVKAYLEIRISQSPDVFQPVGFFDVAGNNEFSFPSPGTESFYRFRILTSRGFTAFSPVVWVDPQMASFPAPTAWYEFRAISPPQDGICSTYDATSLAKPPLQVNSWYLNREVYSFLNDAKFDNSVCQKFVSGIVMVYSASYLTAIRSDILPGQSFSLRFWAKVATNPAIGLRGPILFHKIGMGAPIDWTLSALNMWFVGPLTSVLWHVQLGVNPVNTVSVDAGAVDQWQRYVVLWDQPANRLTIQVNNNTPAVLEGLDQGSYQGLPWLPDADRITVCWLPAFGGVPNDVSFADDLAIWGNTVLTPAQLAWDWNFGEGRRYPGFYDPDYCNQYGCV